MQNPDPNVSAVDFAEMFEAARQGAMYAGGLLDVIEIAAIAREKRGIVPFLFTIALKQAKEFAWDYALEEAKRLMIERMDYARDFFLESAKDPQQRQRIAEAFDRLVRELRDSGEDADIFEGASVEEIVTDPDKITKMFVRGNESLSENKLPEALNAEDASSLMAMGEYGRRVLMQAIRDGAGANLGLGTFSDLNEEMQRQQRQAYEESLEYYEEQEQQAQPGR